VFFGIWIFYNSHPDKKLGVDWNFETHITKKSACLAMAGAIKIACPIRILGYFGIRMVYFCIS
jgi:hypothetical protein